MIIGTSAARAALCEADFRHAQKLAGEAKMSLPAFLSLCDGMPVAPLTVAEMAIRDLWWVGYGTLPRTAAIAEAAIGGWKVPSGIDGWAVTVGRENAVALDIDRYGDQWRRERVDPDRHAGARNPRLWERDVEDGGGQVTDGRRTVTFGAAEWRAVLRAANESAERGRDNRYPCEGYHVMREAWRQG